MEETEIIKEFVIESNENLERLDREMVGLENRPDDRELLASVFRTLHTIKGTCGFLNFSTLEKITHQAENILSQLRDGERKLTAELVSLILDTADAVRTELRSIEATEKESGAVYPELLRRQAAAVARKDETKDEFKDEPEVDPLSAAESGPSADPAKQSALADSTIRVDVGLLNKLMNLVGELVLVRNQILQFNSGRNDAVMNATSQRLNLITTELQGGVMKTRMQPIGMVWGKLPRIVRDLSKACGKQIALQMDGEATELDKTVIEAIKDPLTHIVRNACDHGIETPADRIAKGKPAQGTLLLRAYHDGGNVNIEITDDGGGMDPKVIRRLAVERGLMRATDGRLSDREVLNFVFVAGFSTAREVSNISGRGVGMDVVRTNIERIGGNVDLISTVGTGTTVKIKIPLTLAIIPGLVVNSSGERFVIPQVNLLELVRLEGERGLSHIERVNGTPLYRQRGKLLPLTCLAEVLGLSAGSQWATRDVVTMVILQAEDCQFGLIVDDIQDTQEIVVKPLGSQLKGLRCYEGATIMGDGRVSLILDVPGIARAAGVVRDGETASEQNAFNGASSGAGEKQKLLLFRAGRFERLAVPLSLVARLEDIALSRIERAAGSMAVQYRNEILPLVRVADHLEGAVAQTELSDPVEVVVFADGDRRIGLIVDRIIDIVEDVITANEPSRYPGMLGSAVIGGRVTDFIDLSAIIRSFDEGWFERGASPQKESTVLLADGSAFSRGLMRSFLEIAGHRVIEASGPGEAMVKLGLGAIDMVAASLDLPDRGAFALLDSIRKHPELRGLPVMAISSAGAGSQATGDFSELLDRFDRMAMLRSLDRLAAAIEARKPVLQEQLHD
jgi:two-component system, chemotaxis family, sensor kinase CheA